ncbi:MAG: sugar phosphate nucleotidyltransferase [Pseudomonadota bacterium]
MSQFEPLHSVRALDGGMREPTGEAPDDLHRHWAVVMAGGRGSRLGAMTSEKPKPLVEIGGVPVVERVISDFSAAGVGRVFVSVNYLADQIIDRLGDGRRFSASVRYLREEEPTGTAGSLALLPGRPPAPFFVMNADILADIDFSAMMRRHIASGAALTLAAREVRETLEYGVLDIEAGRVARVREKPVETYSINAGVYVFDPKVLDFVGATARRYDMTDLIDDLLVADRRVEAYPLTGYWRDIGRPEDVEQANLDFAARRAG